MNSHLRRLGVSFLTILAILYASAAAAECTIACAATVPSTGQPNVAVQFGSRDVPCDCAGTTSYAWTFGDGGTSTAANPSYAYANGGTYNWQLTVSRDTGQCIRNGSISISGGAITPAAGTYSGTTSAGRPFSIVVNGSSQITAWTIGHTCFGTGTSTTNSTCNIVNGNFTCGSVFCAPFNTSTSISGSFSSSTSVSGTTQIRFQPNTTSGCCSQSPTFTASSSSTPLTADAGSNTTNGLAPLLVNFTGSASGGNQPYTYRWDFGDCLNPSTDQNPSHQYQAGNWTAILTVTDSSNAKATDTVEITSQGPSINTVTPSSGPVAGGTAVTIDGSNFGGLLSVTFGGSPGSVTGSSASSIQVTTPQHGPGPVDVTVTTQGGSATSSGGFVYNLPPFGAPAGLMATAAGTSPVNLSWNAVADADHYEVVRSTGGAFTVIATPAGAAASDVNVSPNTSYVYKVRAVNASSVASADSAPDAATTIVFPDDPLIAGSTTIAASHLTTLRTAVNAMRVAGGLTAVNFTDPSIDSTIAVKKVHLDELRSRLDQAREAIGVPALVYTDSVITAGATSVRSLHFQELRNGTK